MKYSINWQVEHVTDGGYRYNENQGLHGKEAKMRGYFGMGIINGKNNINYGTLLRSLYVFGGDFAFIIGKRFKKKQTSDTYSAYKHLPVFEFETIDQAIDRLPVGCQLVAVENVETATPLPDFVHPERAIYLLGAEDTGIPEKALQRSNHTVIIPGTYCLNVAVAESIVMYDRIMKAGAK